LSHLIIRLVNKEWKRRIKDEGKWCLKQIWVK
jgi:hypothetical protein